MQSSAIFPLFYLPPVCYFNSIRSVSGGILLEKFEHYPKQTYRNRATILSPNGTLDLIIPVIRGSKLPGGTAGVHSCVKDVKISYEFDWQRLHWKSLESCYRSSAYFEFYEDELHRFYKQKYEFLFDFNIAILDWVLHKLKQPLEMEFTDAYQDDVPSSLDFRTKFHKGRSEPSFIPKKYPQVFSDRFDFIPDISIADLLFNQGPQASNYI